MAPRALPSQRQRLRRERRHGAILDQPDRRDLERAGWRTTLEFRENNTRARDGRLLHVEQVWYAEAERDRRTGPVRSVTGERGVDVIASVAADPGEVWAKLRLEAELADVRRSGCGAARAS